MTKETTRRLVLGALLGSVALWAALRDVDAPQLASTLAGTSPALVALSLGATLASVVLLTVRWKLLFAFDRRDVPFWTLFRMIVIGQMLNIAGPLRVGEVARLYGVSKQTGVDVGRVLATLSVEKVLEVSVFGAAAVAVVALVTLRPEIATAQAAWIAIPLMTAAAVWALARYVPLLAPRLAVARHLPEALNARFIAFSDAFAAGVAGAALIRAGSQLLGLSMGAMLLPAAANQLLLIAFGLDLAIWSGLALLIVLQVGSVPPSLPGRLGVFQLPSR